MIILIVLCTIIVLVSLAMNNWLLYKKLLKQLVFIEKMVNQNARHIDIAERQVNIEEQQINIGSQTLQRLTLMGESMEEIHIDMAAAKKDVAFLRSLSEATRTETTE